MKKFITILLLLAMALSLVACGETDASSVEENAYQETLMKQSSDIVGMPDITEFYEKKLAKEIFENVWVAKDFYTLDIPLKKKEAL